MKESTKNIIQGAIDELTGLGGLKDSKIKEVVDKLKNVVNEEENPKK